MNTDLELRYALIAVSAVLVFVAGAAAGLALSDKTTRPRWTANRADVVILAIGVAGMAVCTLWSNLTHLHDKVKPPAIGFLAFLAITTIGAGRVVYRMSRNR